MVRSNENLADNDPEETDMGFGQSHRLALIQARQTFGAPARIYRGPGPMMGSNAGPSRYVRPAA